jgi:hypothetical protein
MRFGKLHEKHCPKIICWKQKLFSRHDKNRLKRMNSEQKSTINEEFQEKIWIFREWPLSLRHHF